MSLAASKDLFGQPRPQRAASDRNAEGRRQIAIVEYLRWVRAAMHCFSSGKRRIALKI